MTAALHSRLRKRLEARRLSVLSLSGMVFCSLSLSGAIAAQDIVINEVHFAADTSGRPELRYEYVELYHLSTPSIQIGGWELRDSSSILFVLPAMELPPDSFLVVYSSGAAGDLIEDTDLSDGSGLLIADSSWAVSDLVNSGDAVQLYDGSAPTGAIKDFLYYDESNVGDPAVDDDAVASGIWKDGEAIDTLSSASSVGRAVALAVDGQASNEIHPSPDAEDLDWFQYSALVGGTPGSWNDPATIFRDAFEAGTTQRWAHVLP